MTTASRNGKGLTYENNLGDAVEAARALARAERWMLLLLLDTAIQSRSGVSLDDLSDYDTMGQWEGDCSPEEAAQDILEDNGWEAE